MSKVEQADKHKNVDWALDYAEHGFYVFPLHYVLRDGGCSCRAKNCKRIGKHPTTRNGVLEATTDPDQIRKWWTAGPHYNIGIATGHELPGGGFLIAVDVDTDSRKGKVGAVSLTALVAEHGELPETLMQQTGSGGTHYFFRTAKPYKNDSTGRIGKDIDCRCHSGYVVAPPSNHYSGGRYEWLKELPIAEMPVWVGANLVVEGEEQGKSKVDVTADAGERFGEEDTKPHDKLTRSELVKILKSIPGDERDVWWKCGAALKTELGDDGFEVWDEWSQTSDKYDAKIQQVQWRSFKPGELSVGTIIHFAKEHGWRGFDKEAADDPAIREQWVFCVGIKRFIEIGTMQELDCDQFTYRHAHLFKRGRASEHVLRSESFQKYDHVTHWPEQPSVVVEDGIQKFNTWRPSGVTPEPGSVEPFLNHVNYLFPNPEEARIVLDYLAYQVQHPGKKVHWALLIQGTQGNGKSYLGYVMRLVLGPHNVRNVQSDTLHETFTGWLRNTQFIVVEELMARGRMELMNKLKPMITEPWVTIREMYKPVYEQKNRFNFLFLTNHPDPIVIDDSDRRYCVLHSPSPPHPDAQTGYYGPLFAWTDNNAPVLLDWMQARDLRQFEPKAHAPMTEAKAELIKRSMPALDQWIAEMVEALRWPFHVDLIAPSDLTAALPDFGLRGTSKDIGAAFQRLRFTELGYKRYGTSRDNAGRAAQITLWAVRDGEKYRQMSTEQVRQLWVGQAQQGMNDDPAAPSVDEVIRSRRGGLNMVKETKPM
jgi:hypothetical protein